MPDPPRCEMAVGIAAFGGDRTDADVRAILRHPRTWRDRTASSAEVSRIPEAGGRSCAIRGGTWRAGRLHLARGRHTPFSPRCSSLSSDRPRPDPPGFRGRPGRDRPRDRHRSLNLRGRPNPGRGSESRHRQRHDRPGRRRTNRRHTRPRVTARVIMGQGAPVRYSVQERNEVAASRGGPHATRSLDGRAQTSSAPKFLPGSDLPSEPCRTQAARSPPENGTEWQFFRVFPASVHVCTGASVRATSALVSFRERRASIQ